MTKIALYIDSRRKNAKLTIEDIATAMKMNPRTYKRKLATRGFDEEEILLAAKRLEFDIIFLPKEADIFTA